MTNFGDYQNQFYSEGVSNITSEFPFTSEEFKQRAQQVLNPLIWGYIAGGAGDENTQRINVQQLRRYGFIPRMLIDRTYRDMSVTFLGRTFAAPIFLCPVGVLGAVASDGDLQVARAAARLDIAAMYSTLSQAPMEEVAQERGSSYGIFQLYPPAHRDLTKSFVQRAQNSGFDALAITVDTAPLGWRPRDLNHGFIPMIRGKCIANYTSDPIFLRLAGVKDSKDLTPFAAGALWATLFNNTNFTWEDIAWIRTLTTLPIIIKGICSPEDAAKAHDLGIDAIACSNHGGRQANGGIPAISHLEHVVEAAKGTPVTFDSGIRDGIDILRASALGATLVGIARPYVYALAIGGKHAGTDAIVHLISSLLAEADLTMTLDGYTYLKEIVVHKVN